MYVFDPLYFTDSGAPATPNQDECALVLQKIATDGDKMFARLLGEDGIYSSLQSHFARNDIGMATGNFGSTSLDYRGMAASGTTGTGTARTAASTNRATRTSRVGFVSTAVAGNMGGIYTNVANQRRWTIGTGTALDGGGFLFIARFVPADPATVATAHMFVGLLNATGVPTATANPNALTNAMGIAQLNGGTNLQFVYGGSAAQTPVDLGANFPAGGVSTDLYELIMYAPPNANNKVAFRVERINTGHVFSQVLTAGTPGTQLPASTTFLGPRMYRSNNATALAVHMDIAAFYCESNL